MPGTNIIGTRCYLFATQLGSTDRYETRRGCRQLGNLLTIQTRRHRTKRARMARTEFRVRCCRTTDYWVVECALWQIVKPILANQKSRRGTNGTPAAGRNISKPLILLALSGNSTAWVSPQQFELTELGTSRRLCAHGQFGAMNVRVFLRLRT